MDNQPSLFDEINPNKQARTCDPATSKKAAQALKPGTQFAKLVQACAYYPNRTAHELGELAGLRQGVASYWKRVSDLVEMGDFKVTGTKICTISGHECQTYALTHQGIWKSSELERRTA